MARTRLINEYPITVGEEAYIWWLQRQPQGAKDPAKRRGMAIAVRHSEGKREAVLEFPPGLQPRFGASQFQDSQIAPALVAKAISSALEAGWEPFSRGKTVNFAVDEFGG